VGDGVAVAVVPVTGRVGDAAPTSVPDAGVAVTKANDEVGVGVGGGGVIKSHPAHKIAMTSKQPSNTPKIINKFRIAFSPLLKIKDEG
jgi:hypothetical protein